MIIEYELNKKVFNKSVVNTANDIIDYIKKHNQFLSFFRKHSYSIHVRKYRHVFIIKQMSKQLNWIVFLKNIMNMLKVTDIHFHVMWLEK